MKFTKIPEIDGPHAVYARQFRAALAWKEWLVYDIETGEKTGSYRKAGAKLGLSAPYIESLYRGRQHPSGVRGVEIATRLGVSANWLTSNEGPMIADNLISISDLDLEDQVDILTRLRLAHKKIADRKAANS
jgi:hypothetical protein